MDLPPSIYHLDGLDKLYSDIYLENLLVKVFIEYIIFFDRSIFIIQNIIITVINEVIVKKILGLETIFESLNITENVYEGAINLYISLISEFL